MSNKSRRTENFVRLQAEVTKEDKQKLEQLAFETGTPVCMYIRKAVKQIVKDVKLPPKDSRFE
jgi:predicted DNA-binding protein